MQELVYAESLEEYLINRDMKTLKPAGVAKCTFVMGLTNSTCFDAAAPAPGMHGIRGWLRVGPAAWLPCACHGNR